MSRDSLLSPGVAYAARSGHNLKTGNTELLGFRIFPVDGRIGKFFSSSAMVSLLLANELIFLSQNLKRKEIYY